jgi:hypothetical protein
VALALASAHGDEDARSGDVGRNTSNRVAGGAAGGFKLVGIVWGAFVHSHPLGMATGAYGASMSVYAHFIPRGRDVVFPKNKTTPSLRRFHSSRADRRRASCRGFKLRANGAACTGIEVCTATSRCLQIASVSTLC